jgi:hypothetical protein
MSKVAVVVVVAVLLLSGCWWEVHAGTVPASHQGDGAQA